MGRCPVGTGGGTGLLKFVESKGHVQLVKDCGTKNMGLNASG